MIEKDNQRALRDRIKELERIISRRDHTEEAIVKERDFISQVLYWIDSLVVVIDLEGYIVNFNRASERLSGYRFEEVRDRPFWDILLLPEEKDAVKATIKDVIHKELPKTFQNFWVTKTGERHLISWMNSVLTKPDGAMEYILCTGIDITEQTRAEAALKEGEAKYRELVQNANSIIIRLDTEGHFTFFNEYAEKFFGYKKEEILGSNAVGTIIPEIDTYGKELASLIDDIVRSPDHYVTYENENMRRNGERVWVAWTNKAIYDQRGEVVEILCIGNDVSERKKAEGLLESQNQLMSTLLDNLQVGVFMIEAPTGKPLLANRRAKALLGRGIMPEADRATLAEVYQAYQLGTDELYPEDQMPIIRGLSGEEHSVDDMVVVHPDGSRVYLEVFGTPVMDQQGNVIASLASFSNITERKQSEKALLASEEKHRNIFENSVVGFFQSTPEGRFLSVNSAFARMLGYASPEELISRISSIPKQYYVDPEDRKRYQQLLQEFGQVENFEFRARRKDGSRIWVSNSTRAYFDQEGRIIRYEGVVIDITERKAAETALHDSENQYKSLIELNPEAIYVCREGEIIYANQAAMDILGAKSKKDLIGRIIFDLIHPEYREAAMHRSRLAIQTGEPAPLMDFVFLRLDEGETYVQATAAPVIFEGEPAVLSAVRDVTEQRRAEAEKTRLESRLQQAQKMESIGTLAGGIAHDFNNILVSIIGYTELSLDDVEKGSPLEKNLKEVLVAGKRATDLVKQILAFSRQTEIEEKPFKMSLSVLEALKLLRASMPSTIEIEQDLQSDSLVMGDSTQIHQVLMNLCTNAAHAMEDNGGVLTVTLTDAEIDSDFTAIHSELKPGKYVCLTVGDTGVGMPPEVLEKIFDPFFTTKEKGKGTGMGLSVVHGIIHSHGGTIYAYSKPGMGSNFKVFLPAIERRMESDGRMDRPVPTGSESILFIDDEPAIARLGKQIVESLGYSVVARTSSVDALELFKSQKDCFDLVITDMTMPKMTGENLAKEFMALRPDIPIILCTGFSAKMDEKKALSLGIRAFISKPILKREIAETIRSVLDG